MKNIRLKMSAVFSLVLSCAGWAGVGSSGGGFAVVCRLENNQIFRAELLDLYEAKAVDHLELIAKGENLFQDYARGILVYRKLLRDPRPIDQDVVIHFQKIMNSIEFVPNATYLEPTNDLGERFTLPWGCALEQVAVYRDDTNQLFVNQEVWERFDSLNQAALLQHEVVYRMYRGVGEKSSRNVRKVVGRLHSTTPGTPLSEMLSKNYSTIIGGLEVVSRFPNGGVSRGSGGSRYVYMYVDQNPGETSPTVLQITNLLGRELLGTISIAMPARINTKTLKTDREEDFEKGSRLIAMEPNASYRVNHKVADGPFYGYSILVSYEFGKPFQLTILNPEGKLVERINMEVVFHNEQN